MNAFKTHDEVISNYKSFLQSFINIKDPRIGQFVESETMINDILPKPLVQFNPSFEKGESFDELEAQNLIHKDLSKAIGTFKLYKHQAEAIKIGVQNKGFIVTSGTGSGKSLTFLATIFNDIFKQGEDKKKGVKAILVYPMNALINSQFEEIEKYRKDYENNTGEKFPVTYAKYTGQESGSDREKARLEEPDIILTNYMMLELIMTREAETWLRESIKHHLKYLIFDELHTYRGRQGSDVSLLNRRIQALAKNDLIYIGTSATMASRGTPEEKKIKVAEVATQIFGKKFEKDQIINEFLEPCTLGKTVNDYELAQVIEKGIDKNLSEEEFAKNNLANWLELDIALKSNQGVLERGKPKTLDDIGAEIKSKTSQNVDQIKKVLKDLLEWAERINVINTSQHKKTYLPFRFHQFISQTGSISVTLEPRDERLIVSSNEKYVKKEGEEKELFPVLFSRYSGVEFLCVELDLEENKLKASSADAEGFQGKSQSEIDKKNITQEDFKFGFVVLDEGEDFWSYEYQDELPDSWWNKNRTKLKPYYEMVVPKPIYFNSKGDFSFEAVYPIQGYYMPAKLRYDPTAQIVYEDPKTKDYTKLARLGSEGRSTATSVLSLAIIESLSNQNEIEKDQKLLSFTDNRQDASLQSGHFNDFYSTIRLRSALYNAIKKAGGELEIHQIPGSLYKTIGVNEKHYAEKPSDDPNFPIKRNVEAFQDYLTYRVLLDLKRGWRYTLPNLEQVALLEIEYYQLRKLAADDSYFEKLLFLDEANEDERYFFLKELLDYFRTSFALDYSFFDDIDTKKRLMNDRLKTGGIWSLGEEERMEDPTNMVFNTSEARKTYGVRATSIGERSNFGKFIKKTISEKTGETLRREDYIDYVEKLLMVLSKPNLIIIDHDRRDPEIKHYRLNVESILWKLGDGKTPKIDRTRLNYLAGFTDKKPNEYFQNLYESDFGKHSKELLAKEHTGQLNTQDRIEREDDFRSGKISALYCSPTMELGIDIANLNIVHMRNVPPNAANYAQRGGRAGRGGQTALVFTYCSNTSPHDIHYFEHSAEMVAGIVQPPKIDLINEELILGHLDAFLLMKMRLSDLSTSVKEVLNLSTFKLSEGVQTEIENQITLYGKEYQKEFEDILSDLMPDLKASSWFYKDWITNKIKNFSKSFESAFKRWIVLFQNAQMMKSRAQAVIDDYTVKSGSDEKKEAERQRSFAERQIYYLFNDKKWGSASSEFYVFRYLAAEGFLPGYNFTRLPVRAVLGKGYRGDVEVVSRPRNLALREFGPKNLIYHSGNKFRVNRIIVNDFENSTEKMKISKKTGYAFLNAEIKTANVDPLTQSKLNGTSEIFTNVVEFSEVEGKPTQRITCIEEERTRSGYEIESYFNYPKGVEYANCVVLKRGGEKLLQLFYNGATQLIQVNRKARRSKSEAFMVNKTNGYWVSEKKLKENPELEEDVADIYLYTKDTADTLYIQPMENIGAEPEQIISLSYALKRGIEKLFLVEESEIGVTLMGDEETPNIMIYEAAEGSLGILSQLIHNENKMIQWFKESYRAIHYDPETFEALPGTKDIPKASYKDLLSYYNQKYHNDLDRESIKEILEYLIQCDVESVQGEDRDRMEQYQYLLENYDRASDTELKFLKYLYENDYALPDIAQQNMKDYYISADFIYKNQTGGTLVFVDGSVHDTIAQQEDDTKKRTNLINAGYDIIVWRYDEPLEQLMERRKDIFRKVK